MTKSITPTNMYVGRNKCGCVTAVAYADNYFDAEDFTKRMVNSQRTVDILPKEQALQELNFYCDHAE